MKKTAYLIFLTLLNLSCNNQNEPIEQDDSNKVYYDSAGTKLKHTIFGIEIN